MKAMLFTVLMLLVVGYAYSKGYCHRPVVGQFAYSSSGDKLFAHRTGKDGLYKIITDNPSAYTDCGEKMNYKKGDTIYVYGAGDFYEGSYKGKTGKWAEIIVDLDNDGPQYGTLIYVLCKDLKHVFVERPKYALGPDSETNPFVYVEKEEATYQIKKTDDIYYEEGGKYSGFQPGDIIEVYRHRFYQGSFKGRSGIWVSVRVERIKSAYIPLDDIEMIASSSDPEKNLIFGVHYVWIIFASLVLLLIIIVASRPSRGKSYSSTYSSYSGTGYSSSDYSGIFTSSSNSASESKPNVEPFKPYESPLKDTWEKFEKDRQKEEIDRQIAWNEKIGRDSDNDFLKYKRDNL